MVTHSNHAAGASLSTLAGGGEQAGQPRRVLVVDDHELIGQSLGIALRAAGHSSEYVAGPDAASIASFASAFGPDVVILDLDLGRAGSGRPLIGTMGGMGAVVIVLTASTDPVVLAGCLDEGAAAVLGKSVNLDRVLEAVRRATTGASPMGQPDRDALKARARRLEAERRRRLRAFDHLTPREREVLLALGEGHAPAEIAELTFTSVATVRGHIKSILAKLGVHSQLAAVAKARHAGWLADSDR